MGEMNKTEMLRMIAEHYHITRNVDFAKFFELSEPTAFSRMKNGYLDYEEIYRRCPDISPDWLLSGGEGEMLRSERDGDRQGVSQSSDKEPLRLAMEALTREQTALDKAQDHITSLISVLSNK